MDLRQRFIDGMSYAACTVNVVTTDGEAGRHGLTVSAMSSVSADGERPLLLVCVNKASAAATPIIENGIFCVNVLRDDQAHISDAFAGRIAAKEEKFASAAWTRLVTGAPCIVDALVAFDCRLVSTQELGTHYVFFGAVEDIFQQSTGSSLIYSNRAYGKAVQLPRKRGNASPDALKLGAFHTFAPYIVPEAIGRLVQRGRAIDLRLLEGDQQKMADALRAGDIDLALVYDWDLGPEIVNERLIGLQPYVLLAEGDPLAAQSRLDLEQLVEEPMVLLDGVPSAEFFLSLFRTQGLEPKVAYRVGSFEMVRGLVGHGLGYSILVTKPAASMTYDGRSLTTRPLTENLPPRYLALASRRDDVLPDVARDFASVCREHLQM